MERHKILVVDDDREFAANLRAAFGTRPYHLEFVSSLARAQEVLLCDRPDLVVLGEVKPSGDIFELHHWLKQDPGLKRLPLIVVDRPTEKQLNRGLDMGQGLWHDAENYFFRPLEAAALVPVIEKLLDETAGKIKVLVADGNTLIRQAIHAVVNLQRDMHVVAEAATGREAVAKTMELAPDVVVIDVAMPDMDGLEATRCICEERKQTRVLVLTPYESEERAHAAYQAGAFDVIAKESAGSKLIASIRAASQGEQLWAHDTFKKIKVLVADDHGVVREGIHALVDLQGDMSVVGEATNGIEAVAKTQEYMPDVVLMDIVMPDMNGLEATRQICERFKNTKVLMLSQYGDEENVSAAYRVGAFGFIHKGGTGSELTDGIRAASRGEKRERPAPST
ncbi:MAG: response regulator [Chloroflexi bacterium]|nr:response regulator [Chloroflexota bacterium]